MDEILQSKTISLPLGVRCMELNIKEVDAAVKEFIKKSTYPLDISTAPSWKFPHINIEKLDISSLMETYRRNTLPDEIQYLELLEMLIDRLYFSLIAMYQCLGCAETQMDAMGQGDCRTATASWDMDTMNKKSARDQTPRPFHMPNMGILLRQIHSKLLSTVDFNSQNFIKTHKTLSCKSGKQSPVPNVKSCSSQTDLQILSGCDSCFISQNLLKFIKDMVYLCMEGLAMEVDESQIQAFRQDLQESVWIYSQRATVVKWCEAIQSDCNSIVEKAITILRDNSVYKESIDVFRQSIAEENRKCSVLIDELRNNLKTLEDEVQHEKKQKHKYSKQRDSAISTATELDQKLLKKDNDLRRVIDEKSKVQKKLENLEESHVELQETQFKTLKELGQLRNQLETKVEETKGLEGQIGGLEAQIKIKEEERQQLNKDLERVKIVEKENEDLNKALVLMKKRMEAYKKAELKQKEEKDEDAKEIKRLKDELEKKVSEIELLTLYPDLNGPINPPTNVAGSPIEAMQMQVDSNQVRISVLKNQTERLDATLTKLRSHLKKKSKDKHSVESFLL